MKTIFPSIILMIVFSFHNPIYSQKWEPVSLGDLKADYEFQSISVVNEHVIWALADSIYNSNIPADFRPVVMRSIDGGLNWDYRKVSEAMGRYAFDIHGLDDTTAIFTTNQFNAADDRPVFKTVDGGKTWQKIVPPNGSGGVIIHFFDNKNGLVVNRNTISTTSDAGETWTAVPAANIPTWTSNEYNLLWTACNYTAAYGDRFWVGTSRGRVMRTIDRGVHWEMFKVGTLTDNIQSIAFTDSLNGVAVAPQNGSITYTTSKLFSTSDGGKTWSALPAAPMKKVTGLAAIPGAANHYLVGSVYSSATQEPLLVSNSDGLGALSWENQLDSFYLDGADFISPTAGYVAGFSSKKSDEVLIDGVVFLKNYIYKWNGNLLKSDEKPHQPADGLIIYPNPVTDILEIGSMDFFERPDVIAEVFDLAGRLVFSKKIPGRQLDVSSLPEGMYFLTMTTIDKVVSAPFVKA